MTIPFERFKQFVDDDGKLTLDATTFLEELAQPQEWIEVTAQGAGGNTDFENSWANRGAPHETAAFYKDPFNVVHLKGAVDAGTNNTTAFTLPSGYRPLKRETFTGSQIASPTSVAQIKVDASGAVTPVTGSTNGAPLSGITFRV